MESQSMIGNALYTWRRIVDHPGGIAAAVQRLSAPGRRSPNFLDGACKFQRKDLASSASIFSSVFCMLTGAHLRCWSRLCRYARLQGSDTEPRAPTN